MPNCPATRDQVLRVIPSLRADHVARDAQLTQGRTLYFSEYPDLDGTVVPAHMTRVGRVKALGAVLRFDGDFLELAEPLWVRNLPIMVLMGVSVRVKRFLKKGRTTTCAYAIENSDLVHVVTGRVVRNKLLRWSVTKIVSVSIALAYDKIAFGGPQAQANYMQCSSVERMVTATFDPLPARPYVEPVSDKLSRSVVFVGRLEGRKGVPQLLDAWSRVIEQHGDAVLTIVGDGPLSPEVQEFADVMAHRCNYVGRLQHSDVPAVIRSHEVLAAPSVPWGRWREQVGLPVTEALREGVTVVTTDQTALSPWLKAHGHRVVATPLNSVVLADALVDALSSPLTRADVVNSLPRDGGRILADHWLHSNGRTVCGRNPRTARTVNDN